MKGWKMETKPSKAKAEPSKNPVLAAKGRESQGKVLGAPEFRWEVEGQ